MHQECASCAANLPGDDKAEPESNPAMVALKWSRKSRFHPRDRHLTAGRSRQDRVPPVKKPQRDAGHPCVFGFHCRARRWGRLARRHLCGARIDRMPDDAPALPERIASRFRVIASEVQKVVDEANQKIVTEIPERIAFRYESAVLDRDILSDYERAQSVSFVTRFDHFPANLETHFTTDDRNNWRIANLWDLRQALNDFRSIIQNQSDSVHYQNVHNTWYKALRQTDKSKGTVVRVLDVEQHDVTDAYAKRLGERNQAIRHLISAFEYDYLYNGFLQHSDPKFSKRLFQDYMSGEINYLLWKHVLPLGILTGLLRPYYMLMRSLTFLGPH